MSIHITLGKPGSGKSFLMLRKIIRELRESKRNVVTNLAINLDKLNEYVQKKYPSEDLRIPQRVRILKESELREFWTIRGPVPIEKPFPRDLPPFAFTPNPNLSHELNRETFQVEQVLYQQEIVRRSEQQNEWLAWVGDSEGNAGVCYVLDECHIAFNARDWATIGRGALNYLSQHRKLSDLVFPVTQAVGNLDKQFRSVAEDFTTVRNEYNVKLGIFRGRGRFVWKSYYKEPDPKSEPYLTGTFTFDGEEKCYDTARGVGVHGTQADIGSRAKGISIWWAVPMMLGVASLAFVIPWLASKAATKVMAKAVAKPNPSPAGAAVAALPGAALLVPQTHKASILPNIEDHQRASNEQDAKQTKEIRVIGYVVRGRSLNVSLSDGRVLTEGDGSIARIDRNAVVLKDGTRYYMKPIDRTALPIAPVPLKVIELAKTDEIKPK